MAISARFLEENNLEFLVDIKKRSLKKGRDSAIKKLKANPFLIRTITVGYGITPHLPFGSQTLLPIGNFTPPQRIYTLSIIYFILFVKLFIINLSLFYKKVLLPARLQTE